MSEKWCIQEGRIVERTKCSSLRFCECLGVSSLVHSAASSRLRINTAEDLKVLITPAAAPEFALCVLGAPSGSCDGYTRLPLRAYSPPSISVTGLMRFQMTFHSLLWGNLRRQQCCMPSALYIGRAQGCPR